MSCKSFESLKSSFCWNSLFRFIVKKSSMGYDPLLLDLVKQPPFVRTSSSIYFVLILMDKSVADIHGQQLDYTLSFKGDRSAGSRYLLTLTVPQFQSDGEELSVNLYLNENAFPCEVARTGHVDLKELVLEDIHPRCEWCYFVDTGPSADTT